MNLKMNEFENEMNLNYFMIGNLQFIFGNIS